MRETANGYVVEFRIPLDMLGSRRSFGLSVVDVDDPETLEIRTITQTLADGRTRELPTWWSCARRRC
ncbi:MAG: hypothetical protein U5R48_07875 [Gammaproteobacteria bacterium]|nr:hypothetical protein [Gammaproteobacteria bacterium]